MIAQRRNPVEGPGIAHEQTPHAPRQGPRPGAHEQVGMVRQERSGVHPPGPRRREVSHPADEVFVVDGLSEQAPALYPSHHDMMEHIGRI